MSENKRIDLEEWLKNIDNIRKPCCASCNHCVKDDCWLFKTIKNKEEIGIVWKNNGCNIVYMPLSERMKHLCEDYTPYIRK